MTRSIALFSLVFLVSCQAYDFERVVPLAVAQTTDKQVIASKRLKPNVMLLVDNSGSMLLPIDPSRPSCTVAGRLCGDATTPCPGSCPTRISDLKSAMNTFLTQSGTIARLGVTKYPIESNQCGRSTNINVQFPPPSATDDNAALSANAQQVNTFIQGLAPLGGTPTGASLEFVGTYGGLNDASDFRDDFVLLLTDGLPNCNEANPNSLCSCNNNCSAAQRNSCSCTTAACSGTNPGSDLCARGCLDQDGSVQNVRALKQKGIRTIVVGFGADLVSGPGPVVLNAMAREGGFARECPNGTNAECGSADTCNVATKLCSSAFFSAANGTELAAALGKISEAFTGDPCEFTLSAKPSDPRYLSVVVDNQSIAADASTYAYDYNANKVTFAGSLCNRLKTSTTQNPVNLEFRIVERL